MTRTTILMAVRNGARYLPEQLRSIAAQRISDWQLVASDDGSTDASRAVLEEFSSRCALGQVRVVDGPRKGAAENFRHLLRQVTPQAGNVAFCDQDDIWHQDHLWNAAQALQCESDPALYGSRMVLCDASGRETGLSPLPRKPGNFRNSLIQNIFSGNTIVMNSSAALFMQRADEDLARAGLSIPLHDWWTYQLLSGCGARLMFDERPGVMYRQHDHNLVGANLGLKSFPKRMHRHLSGEYWTLHIGNAAALEASADRLTAENRNALHHFSRALRAPLLDRLAELSRSGVWLQRRSAMAAFWISAVLVRPGRTS